MRLDERGNPMDDSVGELSPEGRFEIIADLYDKGSMKQREIIKSCFTEEEFQAFLRGVGQYRMWRDQRLYNAIKKAVGERLYAELHEPASKEGNAMGVKQRQMEETPWEDE